MMTMRIKTLNVAPFVGAWIEMLLISYTSGISSSLRSSERGLKLPPLDVRWHEIPSLRSSERGLKSGYQQENSGQDSVAPFVGAWIEMAIAVDLIRELIVAPFVGAWIEIILT